MLHCKKTWCIAAVVTLAAGLTIRFIASRHEKYETQVRPPVVAAPPAPVISESPLPEPAPRVVQRVDDGSEPIVTHREPTEAEPPLAKLPAIAGGVEESDVPPTLLPRPDVETRRMPYADE